MTFPTNFSRRAFLKTSGVIVIGFPLFGGCRMSNKNVDPILSSELPGSLANQQNINAWLEVLDDGNIRIYTGKLELGQGIRIAIAQVAAEELNTNLDMVEVHLAETGVTPNERYTSGSRSIEDSAMSVRHAAAAASVILIEMAAEKYEVDPETLMLENGKVISENGEFSATFTEILDGKQITENVTTPVKLKPKENYKLVGRPIPRRDIERMVKGQEVYVQDLRFPGMVHARVVRPRNHNFTVANFDQNVLADRVDGVLKVVVNGNFIGVITEDEYQAVKARSILENETKWNVTESYPEVNILKDYIKNIAQRKEEVLNQGSFDHTAEIISAQYSKPYIMHGSIGPSCAVALFENGKLNIWSHSQGVYPLRASLMGLTGLTEANIHIKGVPGSGCYGHNGADDVAADAALLAMAYPGKHVRLQWSRQNEHIWEPYGSAMVMEPRASLDASGKITQWSYELWSDSHSTRPGGDAALLLPARYLEQPHKLDSRGFLGGGYRNAEPFYNIPTQQITAHFFDGPMRVSALRALGAYANIFAIESFIEELAEKAGKEPLDFRLQHAKDERTRAILQKLRDMTRNVQLNSGEGLGFGFSKYKNSASYCGVAAKAFVDKENGAVQIRQMWGVIDAGECINPDGLKNQTEGGMIQAASWTLKEAVTFNQDEITSIDWNSYPIFRFRDVPEVEVEVIDRPDEPALGAGEAAQGPASAAIANAIYKACGVRVRDLPITAEKIKQR